MMCGCTVPTMSDGSEASSSERLVHSLSERGERLYGSPLGASDGGTSAIPMAARRAAGSAGTGAGRAARRRNRAPELPSFLGDDDVGDDVGDDDCAQDWDKWPCLEPCAACLGAAVSRCLNVLRTAACRRQHCRRGWADGMSAPLNGVQQLKKKTCSTLKSPSYPSAAGDSEARREGWGARADLRTPTL
eukprot:scaffold14736_cov114-Isochrysis_galbana.AAC.3